MNSILASYDTPADAADAIGALVEAGFGREAITVMSAEPIQLGLHSAEQHQRTRIGWFAVAGGVLGAAAAVLLTTYTSRSVGVVTGGMPIVAPWAFGIIVFEMTALGAILVLFARMVWEARLLWPRAAAEYDTSVTDGKLVLAVACPDDEALGKADQLLGANRVSKER